MTRGLGGRVRNGTGGPGGGGSRVCLHAVKPDERLVQTGHIKGYLYTRYRALAVAKAVSFITRAPAFLKTVSDARVRDDARPSVRTSAMGPPPFAVFLAGVRDRKTERKSEIDGIGYYIGMLAGAARRVRENNDVHGVRGVDYYIYLYTAGCASVCPTI